MRSTRHTDARRATGLILGLLAIPFVSVSAVTALSDVASTTDPRAAVIGIPAVLAGVIVAGLVLRTVRLARSGAIALRAVLAALGRRVDVIASEAGLVPVRAEPMVLVAHVPASVGRRGPPAVRQ